MSSNLVSLFSSKPSPCLKTPDSSSSEKVPARETLARRVRLLRAARGWSQENLGDESGLHRNYIGHIERAELNAGIDNIAKIADALGVTLCALLGPHSILLP